MCKQSFTNKGLNEDLLKKADMGCPLMTRNLDKVHKQNPIKIDSDEDLLQKAKKSSPLIVQNLTVAYQSDPVLSDVSFHVPAQKIIGVLGPNGAGKSTLIKAILGLVPKMSGKVSLFGESYSKQLKRISYMPQRESVDWDFPTDVLDVVLMGRYGHLGWFHRPGKHDREVALHCLDQVGMTQYKNQQISKLSGGQKQRVFLARALAQNADIYFMDEPFSGVDMVTEKAIIKLLEELKQQNKTVLVVHHDLTTVQEYFDYLIMLNRSLIAAGTTSDVFTCDILQETYGGKIAVLDPKSIRGTTDCCLVPSQEKSDKK